MYRWIMAIHVLVDICFLAGLLGTWTLNAFRAASSDAGFEPTARDLVELVFGVFTNAAMWAVLATGIGMLALNPVLLREPWLWLKLTLVLGLFGIHGMCAKASRLMEADPRARSADYCRRMAIATALLMVGIVVAVIVRPFSG